MDLSEFRIGAEFTARGARWRCTDVGTRVVAAIRVDEAAMGWKDEAGEIRTRVMTGAEAVAIGWFDGPPYGVVERLFDEDEQTGCEPA